MATRANNCRGKSNRQEEAQSYFVPFETIQPNRVFVSPCGLSRHWTSPCNLTRVAGILASNKRVLLTKDCSDWVF